MQASAPRRLRGQQAVIRTLGQGVDRDPVLGVDSDAGGKRETGNLLALAIERRDLMPMTFGPRSVSSSNGEPDDAPPVSHACRSKYSGVSKSCAIAGHCALGNERSTAHGLE